MEEKNFWKRTQFWVGIGVSAACLAAIFIFIKPSAIFEALKNTRYELWFLVAILLVAFMLLRAVRWRFLLNTGQKKDEGVSYSRVFHIQNIGYMISNILPLRLGDVARAVLIGSVPPITISLGLSTMIAERVFDLLFFVILFPFTIAAVGQLPPEVKTLIRLTGVIVFIATAVLVWVANRRHSAIRVASVVLNRLSFLNANVWIRRFDDLLRGLDVLTHPKDALLFVGLSIMVWLPIIAGYYVGLHAVNLQPTVAETAFVVCITAFSVTVPSSPGQVGIFEASVTFALAGILGMQEAEVVSFAFLYHGINYIVLGILGIFGISRTGETFSSVLASTKALVTSHSE